MSAQPTVAPSRILTFAPPAESTNGAGKGRQESKSSAKSSVTPSPAPVADDDLVFYDIARKEYVVPDARGRWLALNEGQFKRRCKMRGISTRTEDGKFHSQFDAYVTDLQHTRGVDYVGPLAGCPAGMREDGDRRLLITVGPKLIDPVPGAWPVLTQVLDNVLGDPDHDQLTYWHAWLKTSLEALRAGVHKPGHALCFIGPAEGGKSLLQDLVTELLGGRQSRPYRFMVGQSSFNGEMAGSEHLRLGDEQPHTDLRARRNFGAKIKEFVAEPVQSIEAKYYQTMNLRVFWRLTLSLNDEPETLLTLPPLDDHTIEKIMLFKARKRPMPMPTAGHEEKTAFWSTLTRELPHYVHWLAHDFVIPPELVNQRFGVKPFHHPEIVAEVANFEPHRELLALVDAVLFNAVEPEPWCDTAEKLEQELTADGSRVQRAAGKLLSWRGACGRYLGRLAKEPNSRVREARRNDRREWTILPPREVTA